MKFDYLARTQKGEVQAGTIEAPNRAAALHTLQGHRLIVTKLWSSEQAPMLARKITLFQSVRRKDIFVFFRQLSILVEADVPLVQSLRVLSEQSTSPYFKDVILGVARDIDAGTLFSKAMAKYPKVFSTLCISLIRIGEVSGRLQESLLYLADYLEKEYYFISKVRGAMIYPLFIMAAFLIVAVLLMIVVIPSLTSILIETGQALPLSTRVVIGTSNFMRKWWLAGLLLIIISIPVILRYQRSRHGRAVFDRVKLKIPVMGKIMKQIYLTRLADNLSALIKGGVSIIQSLNIAGQVVGNVVYQQRIFKTRDAVKAGRSISETLKQYSEFTPLFCQMIKTGEETGKLDVILEKLSRFYNKEVENIVNNLSQLIEPLLIVCLGLGAAVLIFSVFMPIYNMVGAF